jgi:hypothetical protein
MRFVPGPRKDWRSIERQLATFLEDRFVQKSLPVSWRPDGTPTVSRAMVRDQLGLSHGVLHGRAELRALLESYDRQIDPAVYTRGLKYALSEDLRSGLMARAREGALPTLPGRPHRIDRAAIARELRWRMGACNSPGVSDFLSGLEAELTVRLDERGLCPYVHRHKRRFDFRGFADRFGADFVQRLAAGFAQTAEIFANAKQRYNICTNVLEELSADDEIVGQVRAGKLEARALEAALWRWRDKIVADTSKAPNGVAGRIHVANSVLHDLAALQIVPPVARLTKPRNYRKNIKHRPTLVEPPLAQQAGPRSNAELIKSEEEDFKAALELEEVKQGGLLEGRIEVLRQLNERRLDAVRKIAEDVLLDALAHWERGQQLMNECQCSGAQIDDAIRGLSKILRERAQGVSSIFPRSQPDLALGKFLTFLAYRWGAMIPSVPQDELGQFYQGQYNRYGGYDVIQGYLSAGRQAVAAALTVFMCDTGANLGTAMAMTKGSIRKSAIKGYVQYFGSKDRAAGKIVYCDLPRQADQARGQRISTPEAIDIVLRMTRPLRSGPEMKDDKIFIMRRRKNRVGPINQQMATLLYKNMVCAARLAPSTPSMIRTSVLLKESLSHQGGTARAKLIADHGSHTVTAGYTQRYPVRLLHEYKIRTFQKQFQAVLIEDIPGAAAKLGIDPETARSLLVEANRNGLGTSCIDRHMPGRRANAAGECTEAESCIGCSHMIVVAHAETVADLLQWKAVLVAVQEDWKQRRPERWNAVWAPSLAFAIVVLSGLERGPHARVLVEAEQIVARRKFQKQHEPAPW